MDMQPSIQNPTVESVPDSAPPPCAALREMYAKLVDSFLMPNATQNRKFPVYHVQCRSLIARALPPCRRDAQPAWLRKSRVLQKRRRALELLTESCRAAVSTARARRQDLKIRGRAYGAPVVALEELETRLQTVERALLELESRRNDFLVWQTAAEVCALFGSKYCGRIATVVELAKACI